jgi:hypothetical protein
MSDLHEAYEALRARLDHLGIDSDFIEQDEDVVTQTVILSSEDED